MAQADIQNERAYQEQWFVFGASKVTAKRHTNRAGQARYFKSVGLGFSTPKVAVEGQYIDKKCPWTSNLSIRGRIMRGQVTGNAMRRTVSCRRNYLKYVNKYQRYEKRHSKFSAHITPALEANVGDEVIVGQCRPISKTVRFAVLKVNPRTRQLVSTKKAAKKFQKH